MHSYRSHRDDPASLVVNQRIVEEHVNEEHYKRWIWPRDMEPDKEAAGAALGQSTLREHGMEIPDASSPGILWKHERPGRWLLGNIETKLWYSGSTASTANISLTLRGYQVKVGVNVTTMVAGLTSGAPAMPGPVAAGNVRTVTFGAYLPVTPDFDYFSWSLIRNTADTYAGILRILAIRHRYVPGQHEV